MPADARSPSSTVDVPLPASRRMFLSTAGGSLASIALSQLLSADSVADEPRYPAQPSHSVPRAKRVIYLFQSGAPSQIDLFDEKPLLGRPFRRGTSRVDPTGAAVDRHDRRAGDTSGRPLEVPFSQSWGVGTAHQRVAPAYRSGRGRPLPDPVDAHRRDQSRSGDHVYVDRHGAVRTAQLRVLAVVRAGSSAERSCPPSS